MFRFLGTLSVFLFLVSCGIPYLHSTFEKNAIYHEGKGYCVKKLDHRGCNVCEYSFTKDLWEWSCTSKHCPVANSREANKCLDYKAKWQLTFSNFM